MTASRYDVVGIGNAIVDVLAHADDAFLGRHGLAKGTMTLIDADRAEQLYSAMPPAIECSGGSAANTMVGVASLGGRAAYIGRCRDDQLGRVFGHDIRAVGVAFTAKPVGDGPATARCLIFVTPDAQRTMQTYLGACADLGPADIDGELIAESDILYLEGYLWDRPQAKAAFLAAVDIARAAGRKVALSLSDPFCVDRHRESFLELIEHHVDVLFANESEITSLYRTHDFAVATANFCTHPHKIAALTRSAHGSVIVNGATVHEIPAEPVAQVVDTTGAGDHYAAGFLYGLAHGHDLAMCGRLGSIAAAEIISHFGARPETPFRDLAAAKLR